MFTNTEDFLLYLRSKYTVPYASGNRDNQFDRLTIERIHEVETIIGVDKTSVIPGDVSVLDKVLKKTFNELTTCHPEQSNIQKCMSIGVVETGNINAFIAKGGDEVYAIIVNSGLMLLLNQAIKLTFASIHPEWVTYCGGLNVSRLTIQHYLTFLDELRSNYVRTGVAHGIPLTFDKDHDWMPAFSLACSETFVICHEIGHFLNGDLTRPDLFVKLGLDDGVLRFTEGKEHEMEYNADSKGFELLLSYNRHYYPSIDMQFSFLSLVTLMDILGGIGIRETYSHPEPKNRVLHIAKSFYGSKYAKLWDDSYSKLPY